MNIGARSTNLVACHRGSAVVEALFTFPVFLSLFTMIVQLAYLELAALVTQHAAIGVARAAVVIAADDPRHYKSPVGTLQGGRRVALENAAKKNLRLAATDPVSRITVQGGFGEGDVVRVRLAFDAPCGVPVGGLIVCGRSRALTIVREAAAPAQAAGYELP